jgi:hypothetical protein
MQKPPSPIPLFVLSFLLAGASLAFAQGGLQRARPLAVPLGWPGYARDPAHNALSPVAAQALNQIHWSSSLDLQPQYWGGVLLIHYGSPLITPRGTIVTTVKTGALGGFRVEGHHSGTGAQIWSQTTDYILAPHNWTPSCGPALRPWNELALPGAGGTLYLRSQPDSATGTTQQVAFYGLSNYQANPALYDSNVVIDTPITSDEQGNLFFGFLVLGSTPIGLESGLARISATGVGSWVAAHTAANDPAIQKVTYNCAPALSQDGARVYVTVNDQPSSGFGHGYLLALDSHTLAQVGRVRLEDARFPANDAYLPDDGTASPCVGPDGDVYIGVLENPFPGNNDRGWMLHFDGLLAQTRIAGAFGWDDTASIVPASAVPSYTGPSSYLLLTKYNNYAGIGSGTGQNKVALLDPFVPMIDPVTGASVMNEVLTVLGPTPDPSHPGGVTEWCINTAVVDATGQCALVNNEDGKLYRWSFVTNTLAQTITLTSGLGEAYTPTLIGPDGIVYAVNNATLFAVGN